MARIAFLLLCHKDPAAIIRQAGQLTAAGDYVAIHFDRRAPKAAFAAIRRALGDDPHVTFADVRHSCGWGDWSLVAATLAALRAAQARFSDATHFYLISGDCMPIKSAAYARAMLEDGGQDLIESFDFYQSNWIKTGFREERLIYRHYFNERSQPRRFYGALSLQQRLRLTRQPPGDLEMMIGSQWWCLRRSTVESLLAFIKARRDVIRFFRSTWIPDETFFQTLVRHLVPGPEIANRSPTFLMFSDYGMPVTFHNDHYDLLLGQDALFARKISPVADDLRQKLGACYASDHRDFAVSGEGQRLFSYLTGRGREGRRFAPRFWESGATLGQNRRLMVIACKKWHVAKRLIAAIGAGTDIPCLGFLFHEEDTPLPDLGGIERDLSKRSRHRRALLRMIFEHFQTDRLVICVDTDALEILQDVYADQAQVRLLELDCQFDEAYLRGHAVRVGLASPHAGQASFAHVLPTLRQDIAHERDQIRGSQFANTSRMSETATEIANAQALAQFLQVAPETAQALAQTPHLFSD